MPNLKRAAGPLWIALAVAAVWLAARQALIEFSKSPALDTRIFWWTILPVFAPVAVGLGLFGWYCLRGEYDRREG